MVPALLDEIDTGCDLTQLRRRRTGQQCLQSLGVVVVDNDVDVPGEARIEVAGDRQAAHEGPAPATLVECGSDAGQRQTPANQHKIARQPMAEGDR